MANILVFMLGESWLEQGCPALHLGPNTLPTNHPASPVTSILILENKDA